jgi:hypothetical protein
MKSMKQLTRASALLVTIMVVGLLLAEGDCASAPLLSQGQTVYVPMYNAVRIGEQGNPFPLAVTLCIRNTDRAHPIQVVSLEQYDSAGKLMRGFLDKPLSLASLATTDVFLKSSYMGGGLYPSFLVRWESPTAVSEPVIEALIIGDRSGQGISFISQGRVVEERAR